MIMRMVLAFWYPRLMREPKRKLRYQKPDYDYADGVSLLVSAFDEGAEAKTEIPDLKGETVMTVTAKRVGDEIHLHVEGGNGNYTVRSLSGCKVVVEA